MAGHGVTRPTVEYAENGQRIYEPDGRELTRFIMDRSPMAIIRGPWGSGKSLACCQRIWQHAVEQNFDTRGKRRSRWFVIRESYPKVETTAMATWLEWFPESVYGKMYTGSKPYVHEVRVGDIQLDVFFAAVDDIASESVFKSLEPSGFWWNELEYATMKMFFAAHARVGRYPPLIEGGSKWSGTIADTNAPPPNHWLPMMTGEVDLPEDMPFEERLAYAKPDELRYFVQPPAVFEEKDRAGRVTGFKVNPAAENLRWLWQPEDGDGPIGTYYRRAMHGKTVKWIQAQLANKLVPMVDGDAVWPNYDDTVHMAAAPLEPVAGLDVAIGMDFGRRPAVLFSQQIGGQRQVQYEITMLNAGATKMAPEVKALLARCYPWTVGPGATGSVRAWGDPKGEDGTQTDERTAYDVFRANGILVRPAPVKQNNIKTRIEGVEYQFDRMTNGRPALLISPRCVRLKMALDGGYRYPKERPNPGEDRKPVKDRFSDVADALQYLILGEGGGREMVGRTESNRPKPVSTTPAGGRSLRRIGR